MVQEIKVGNDTLHFPDGMTDEQMSAAIQKEYGSAGQNQNISNQNTDQQSDSTYSNLKKDLTDKIRLGFQGLSFGTGSSVIAGAKTLGNEVARGIEKVAYGDNLISDVSYREQKKAEDVALEKTRKNQGLSGVASEIIGGLPTGGVLFKAGKNAIASIPSLARTSELAPTLAKNVASGGILSGLYSAGESKGQTLNEIGSDVASGAAAGGILGGILPIAGAAIKKGGTGVLRAIGINPSGEGLLAKNLTPKQASEELQKLKIAEGENSRIGLLEGGNRGITGLAKKIAKQPLEGSEQLVENISEKAAATTDATKNILKGIGDAGNYFKNVDVIVADRSKVSAPLFEKAYQEGARIKNDGYLATLLGDERIGGAIAKARKDFGIGKSSLDNSVEVLHGARQVIDDIIGSAKRQGENNKARAYTILRSQLNDTLYKASPILKEADKTYSGYSAIKNAYEEGITFKSDKSPEEFSIAVNKYQKNPSELEGFKNGVVQSLLQDILAVGSAIPNPAQKVINSELNREKLKLLFKNPAEYQEIVNRLKDEVKIVNTKAKIVGKEPGALTPADDESALVKIIGSPVAGTLKVIGDIISRKYSGIDQKNSMEIAKILGNRKLSIDALTRIAKKGDDNVRNAIADVLPLVISAKFGSQFIGKPQQ